MHETFEHTADLGLRVRAGSLNELFAEAGRALFSVIVDDLASVNQVREVKVELTGDEPEYLLFDWLKELLYFFDAEHLLLSRFEVKVTESRVTGTAWGETLDPDRHALAHEVKAITYHGLNVERRPDEWLAEVIVDI
jgi:SHS2 domain-containing protein